MSTIEFSLTLPQELQTLAREVTGQGLEEDSYTSITRHNLAHHAKTNWQSVQIVMGRTVKKVSLVTDGALAEPLRIPVDYSMIPNGDDVSVAFVTLPPYLNDTGILVKGKTLEFKADQIFKSIQHHVAEQEQNLWIGGRTRATSVALQVLFDSDADYGVNLNGFVPNPDIHVETGEPLWISGMVCRALVGQGLRDQATNEFNAQFMQPMQLQQQNEKED